jgi:hypothetical protein
MAKKIERVKQHFSDNKQLYIGIGIGVVVTAVAVVVTVVSRGDSGTQVIQKINQIAWRPENNQMVINMVERSTPSKPVHLVGTNLFFNSLHEAARETGHSVSKISRNVNGHIPDINGDVFQLLEAAS